MNENMDTSLKCAREVFEIELAALQRTCGRLDGRIGQAVEALREALARAGKIVVTGIGKSYHIGQKIASTLTSTGAPAMMLHPSEAMHGDLGMLQGNDVVLALSYSGESDELVRLLPLIRRAGVRIISITGQAESTLGKYSDIVLDASVEREACPFNMVPTASTTVALAIGDALCIALLKARGVDRDEYASFHPGGAIGRSLLLKVDDIMRTGDRLAVVSQQATVRDALIAMTKAQAGAVAVVAGAEDRTAVGLLTDGDLRRCLVSGRTDFLDRPVRSAMTANPTSVRSGRLAAEALKVFQEHHFDDLMVLAADGQVLGMIDIQDLPKFKVF
ncbi:MAG: KpsF/GutQ family sugar-phosphate isomerase [Kiritimatiellae bacterium]|nr:KpsF/GutQ family sugar-phosphate isomerase [Kiritimatiellia bacterium]